MTTEVRDTGRLLLGDNLPVQYVAPITGEVFTSSELTPAIAGHAIPEIERTLARLMEFRGIAYETLRAYMVSDERREFVSPHADDTSTTYVMKDSEWAMTALQAAQCRDELRALVDPASLEKAFWDEPVSIVQACSVHRVDGALMEEQVACTYIAPDDFVRGASPCGKDVTVLKWHHGKITALAEKNGKAVAAVIEKYRTRTLNVAVAIKK